MPRPSVPRPEHENTHRSGRRSGASVVACCLSGGGALIAAPRDPFTLDRAAERWVEQTLKTLTPDEKIGQLIVPSFESNFMSTDSDTFDMLTRLVRDYHVGGFHVFGASQPAPSVLLNAGYGTVILGQPFSAAFLINRLQALSSVPLLNTADFETGVGFRIFGATAFPRQMAMGAIPGADGAAAGARRGADHRARIARARRAGQLRAGRRREQQPAQPGDQHPLLRREPRARRRAGRRLSRRRARRQDDRDDQAFPRPRRHRRRQPSRPAGDHVRPRAARQRRAAAVSPRRRAGRRSGDGGAHRAAGARSGGVDAGDLQPADSSRPAAHRDGVRRPGLHRLDVDGRGGQDGGARRRRGPRADRRRRSGAAFARSDRGVQRHQGGAGERAAVAQAQIDASVERVLRAKASVGLHLQRAIDLDAVPALVGGRAHEAAAQEAFARAITLVKDDRRQVPLTVPRDAAVLYLSVLDYPSGWQIAAPSRTFIPELKKRWPNVTSIEVSDHTSLAELDLVRAVAPRYARRHRVGVRAIDLGQRTAGSRTRAGAAAQGSRRASPSGVSVPFITTFFGNPYTAAFVPELPATLLTYDFYDQTERAAVRADRGRGADRRPAADHAVAAVQGRARAGQKRDRDSG